MDTGGAMTELEAAQKEIANLEAQRNICLAAAKEAQREAELARNVADAAVEFIDAVDGFGKVASGTDYFDKFTPVNDRLRAAVTAYRARVEGVEGDAAKI